ncbi:MAG: energy transducer TonB [Verrucomicrobiae bacterium]|nr:energy transducer TonB [Verrucomicrobiae bacterium]
MPQVAKVSKPKARDPSEFRALALATLPSGKIEPSASRRSLTGPVVISLVGHGLAIVGAACFFTIHPGDDGIGEIPVIEVSVVSGAETEAENKPEPVTEKTPPPIREAEPIEIDLPVIQEIARTADLLPPDPILGLVSPEPAEPVAEFLIAELGSSMSFPEPKKTSQQQPPKKTSRSAVSGALTVSHGSSKAIPPRPLSPVGPSYPSSARKSGKEGTAWVLVVVKSNGSLRSASIHRSTGTRALDASALACVKRWKFKAGQKDGHAIEASALVKVSFHLD